MKRPFSLLEVTIGLVLTAILLTTLFSSFRHMVQSSAKVEKVREEMHWRFITQLRLKQVFEHLSSDSSTILFYTGSHRNFDHEVLRFTFHNGVDPDPSYCEEIEAILTCDDQRNFSLYTYSTTGAHRRQIFAVDVSHFDLSFFDPEKKCWESSWSHEYLPPVIKIVVDEEVFLFPIDKSTAAAQYS